MRGGRRSGSAHAKVQVPGDVVQNRPSQNMTPWHMEYFKLSVFKNGRSRKVTLTYLPPSFPETGHKTFMRQVLSLRPMKGASSSPKTKW